MILKASQRRGGSNLAAHLMRMDENEHVSLHELRGFTAADLKGAFRETEAISRATKCRQYLFSLSLSPPEGKAVPADAFEKAIEKIEAALGLEGQPRAVVFHEKEGRRHAHCVWSRIDPATMTARQMSFYKTRLMAISRELYLEHGWNMPRGILDGREKSPLNFTLAEWQQARRTGSDPRWLKAIVQDCWKASDGGAAFARALDERCLTLARGDRRGVVLIDHRGEVHALSRLLGLTAKDVRSRFGDGAQLPGVDAARAQLSARLTPALRKHIEETRRSFGLEFAPLAMRRAAMAKSHREARAGQDRDHDAQWRDETKARADRLPRGIRGLWHRLTGQYQKVRAENEADAAATRRRHAVEKQSLIEAQLSQRAALQEEIKVARSRQAKRLAALRQDLSSYRDHARHRDRQHEY